MFICNILFCCICCALTWLAHEFYVSLMRIGFSSQCSHWKGISSYLLFFAENLSPSSWLFFVVNSISIQSSRGPICFRNLSSSTPGSIEEDCPACSTLTIGKIPQRVPAISIFFMSLMWTSLITLSFSLFSSC